ncbi:hypothetical protein [Longimicrobium sp.]|uniref:hypothetical protein n=1 Tax=Longimicrobium sp. TaxID=2029185 RepID=UPI002CA84BA7|nr:hypothetical protein [Longimicrobium sp.]HSU13377.1 hypothetical protein [Longimicrobium sp.]
MSNHKLGLVVTGENVVGVVLDFDITPPAVQGQFTWSLQAGDRVDALAVMYDRVVNFVREEHIAEVVLKASAAGRTVTVKHLGSAELRGVVAVASKTGGATVQLIQKAVVSRTFGERNADEYVGDNSFWDTAVSGDVLKTRREAAFLLLAAKG